MRDFYKKIVVATMLCTAISTTALAASPEDEYANISANAVIMEASDTSIFKPAAIKSLDEYDAHYHLYKGDIISLNIIGFNNGQNENIIPGLEQIVVGPDGYVNLPYVGSVKLAGLTIDEAKTLLTQKLSRYLKFPDMSILVQKYGDRRVQVLGEVNNLGAVELPSDNMNVLAAISKAGWVTTYGRIKMVQVIRIDNGTMYVKEANIKNYIEKHDISQNFELKDGDILYIPKSNKIDFQKDVMPLINIYALYRTLTN